MKIFKIIYSVKENENILQLFDPEFIHKNRHKCKIIYNNKIHSLQDNFNISDRKKKKLGIKLVCFANIQILKKKFEENDSLYKFEEKQIYKTHYYKYIQNLRCSNYKWQKLIYKLNKKHKKIRIFGSLFLYNNKNKCIIIYNDKIYPLQEYFDVKDIENVDNKIEILLIELENITDKSYMFQSCDSLLELSLSNKKENEFDINIKEIKVKHDGSDDRIDSYDDFYDSDLHIDTIYESNSLTTNIISIFNLYKSLFFLPKEIEWNIISSSNMSHMFDGCSSLISLPDISKWDTNKIEEISYMFRGCSSLISLPDISKFNTNNIINMSGIFKNCKSLVELPDISKWNTNKVKIMKSLFEGCSSLISLPDISNWNTILTKDMSFMFNRCSSLESLPNISEWNTKNLTNINSMFKECSSLTSLPNISKWNTENLEIINSTFDGCSSLISLPNISL